MLQKLLSKPQQKQTAEGHDQDSVIEDDAENPALEYVVEHTRKLEEIPNATRSSTKIFAAS